MNREHVNEWGSLGELFYIVMFNLKKKKKMIKIYIVLN